MAVTSGSTVEPKSSHVADESLRPFLQQSFDPADYLNATLSTLHLPTHAAISKPQNAVSLADLSSQTQTLLSHLNAQASRLTNLLTQLTDEILRSGSRLAYEVEVLRGETTSLSETFNDTVKPDIDLFIPSGLSTAAPTAKETPTDDAKPSQDGPAPPTAPEPEYIARLRTLTQVRQQLDTVIQTFNAAMQWPCPPLDSLFSVSDAQSQQQEAKAKEFADNLRSDVVGMISDAADPKEGYEEAMNRIQGLKDLLGVFKGTAEEKSRARFVEGLEKLAAEKLREVERGEQSRSGTPLRGVERMGTPSKLAEKGVGWLDNLGRMRNG